jgi:uncharacterized protein (UPF0147 family)
MTGSKASGYGDILDMLGQIESDYGVPKNIKEKIKKTIDILGADTDADVKISKAMDELDAISDDTNIPAYTRTQIWHIVSLLESKQ